MLSRSCPAVRLWVSPYWEFVYVLSRAWKEEPFVLKHIVVRRKLCYHCCDRTAAKFSKLHTLCVCLCTCVMPGESNTLFPKSKMSPDQKEKLLTWYLIAMTIPYPCVAWHSFERDYITRGTLELGGVLGLFLFSGGFCAWIEINWGVEHLYFEWASHKYESLISF